MKNFYSARALTLAVAALLASGRAAAQGLSQPIIDTCLYVKLQPVWTYLEHDLQCGVTLSKVRYLGDSLVGNRKASCLARFGPNQVLIPGSELVTFYRAGLLELHEGGEWRTVYNYSTPPSPGDTVTFYLPTNAETLDVSSNRDYQNLARFSRHLFVEVQAPLVELSVLTTDHSLLFDPAFIPEQDSNQLRMELFTPGLGSLSGFFGEHGIQVTAGCVSELVCFQTIVSSYSIGDRGCALLSSLNSPADELPGLRLMPNPVARQGCVKIVGLLPNHEVAIVSSLGQSVAFGRDGESICLSGASAGAYLVQVRELETGSSASLSLVVTD